MLLSKLLLLLFEIFEIFWWFCELITEILFIEEDGCARILWGFDDWINDWGILCWIFGWTCWINIGGDWENWLWWWWFVEADEIFTGKLLMLLVENLILGIFLLY